MNKKIYFAGSIRGGRVDAALYQRIIQYINRTDVVLTEHVFPTKPKNVSINGWTGFWVESNIKTKKCAETVGWSWRTFLMIVNVKRIIHVLADC